METTWDRDEALKILLNCSGDFKAGTCNEDDTWYVKKDLLSLKDFIVKSTSFLSKFQPTFRFRIFCFKLDLSEPPICRFCDNLCAPLYGESRFRDICKDNSCKSKKKSETSRKVHESYTPEKRISISQKIGRSNSGNLEEKFGKEKADIIRQRIGESGRGRIQTEEEKLKRVRTRILNNQAQLRPWHSEDVKLRISFSNSVTHSSIEYKIANHESRKIAAKKQSRTMKNKIQSGEFTPNSNNWKKSKPIKIKILDKEMHFRSRWELAYYFINAEIYDDVLEYETIRILYEFEGNERIYIADFFSRKNNQLIEIKPKSRQTIPIEARKLEIAEIWARENEKSFLVIDEDWFAQHNNELKMIIKKRPELESLLKCLI